ncbi:MAG: hypothetical protein WC900_06280 [Oscillospiraceae bacterium]|jgi:uncharacterized ubiquitin-like protein YukD
MYITITIVNKSKYIDIKIDDRQIIRNGIEILKENGLFFCNNADFFRSYSNNKVISSYETFAAAGIHSGDILSEVKLQAVEK